MLSSPPPTSLFPYSLNDLVAAGELTPMDRAEYLHRFTEETDWYNEVVLTALLPGWTWEPLPRPIRSWLRNYSSGIILYLVSCSLWCFYIYYLKRNVYVPEDEIPSNRSMLLQVKYAMKGLPWFCALPTLSEYIVERGWTKCYSSISEVGWPLYFAYLMIYLSICEFTIYWVHRELHEIKPLYKYLHATHHVYNKQNTLSPFAGLASEPMDGLLSAAAHVMCLFLIPTHFANHVALIFFETIWTTNIHDCIHADIWPIMGAGYHTIHHTSYRHNYGHFTILMDWMFGTLRYPEEDANKVK